MPANVPNMDDFNELSSSVEDLESNNEEQREVIMATQEKISRLAERVNKLESSAITPPPPPVDPIDPVDPLPPTEKETVRNVMVNRVAPSAVVVSYDTESRRHSRVEMMGGITHRVDRSLLHHDVLIKGLKPGTAYSLKVDGQAEITTSTLPEVKLASVKAKYPSLYFNQSQLAELKARRVGPYWDKLKKTAEKGLGMSWGKLTDPSSDTTHMGYMAVYGLIANNNACMDKAIKAAIRAADEDPKSIGRGSRRVNLEGFALVYDCLRDEMTPEERSKVIAGIKKYAKGFGFNETDYLWGHGQENSQYAALAALAISADDDWGFNLAKDYVQRMSEGWLASWRYWIHMDWSYLGYTLRQMIRPMIALRNKAGIDFFSDVNGGEWWDKLAEWLAGGLRRDMTQWRGGDKHTYDWAPVRDFDQYIARVIEGVRQNETARWFAQKCEEKYGVREGLLSFIFEYDGPTKSPLLVRKHFPNFGYTMLGRTLLDVGSKAIFQSAKAYCMGHSHRDVNTFAIFHEGDLAIDSGFYDDFGSDHHRNYYQRTVAHNGILIYDPNEKMQVYSDSVVNDGGQPYLRDEQAPHKSRPRHLYEALDPANKWRFDAIQRHKHDTGAGFEYVYGQGERAYGPKAEIADRHLVKVDTGEQHDCYVVYDLVRSSKAAFKKSYLLHSQGKPSVSGSRVTLTNENGALWQDTILPADFDIDRIGGDGKEFVAGGKNFPLKDGENPDDTDIPGRWRIEVSSRTDKRLESFLHVIRTDKTGGIAPSKPTRIFADTCVGVQVGNVALLFAADRSEVTFVAYKTSAEKSILFGMAPLTKFKVMGGNTTAFEVSSSFEGIVVIPQQIEGDIKLEKLS